MRKRGALVAAVGAAGVALWLAGAPSAQGLTAVLSVGPDAEDHGVELTDGPTPIAPSAVRYCVKLPEDSTIDRYAGGWAWRPGQKPSAPSGPQSATATSSGSAAGGGDTSLAPPSGPTAWIQLETTVAYLSFIDAGGNVVGATWEASSPRMFIRRDAASRIHVCVGTPGMQPPAVP
jgi:hypothetical protein